MEELLGPFGGLCAAVDGVGGHVGLHATPCHREDPTEIGHAGKRRELAEIRVTNLPDQLGLGAELAHPVAGDLDAAAAALLASIDDAFDEAQEPEGA